MKLQTVLPTFFLITDLPDEPWKLASSLSHTLASFEPEELVPCYDSIGIYFPNPVSESALSAALETVTISSELVASITHEIPVCYELGPDADSVSSLLSCSLTELLHAHTSVEYRCMAMGFSPGFGYLRPIEDGPLPELWTLPRLSTPRKVVPAGSVAVTGRQAAVYPQVTPGGWQLIGRTPLRMADLAKGEFRLSTGDRVIFHAIDMASFAELWEVEHQESFDFT